MFRIIGGIIGFFMGSVLGILGMIIGAVVGSSLGGSVDSLLFGQRNSSSDNQKAQDAYRRFYEQFYQNQQQQGYNHGYSGNSNSNYGFGSYQTGASDKCYSDLGCSRTDSNDTIKSKYRKLVSQYHPDRMAGKGLTGADLEKAEAKFKTIQNSYDQIKREKGI